MTSTKPTVWKNQTRLELGFQGLPQDQKLYYRILHDNNPNSIIGGPKTGQITNEICYFILATDRLKSYKQLTVKIYRKRSWSKDEQLDESSFHVEALFTEKHNWISLDIQPDSKMYLFVDQSH